MNALQRSRRRLESVVNMNVELREQLKQARRELEAEREISAKRKMTLVHIAGFERPEDIEFAPTLAQVNLMLYPGG